MVNIIWKFQNLNLCLGEKAKYFFQLLVEVTQISVLEIADKEIMLKLEKMDERWKKKGVD